MTTKAIHETIDEFHLFTTFRLDSTLVSNATHTSLCGGHQTDIYLLPYHFDRLRAAAEAFGGFHYAEAMSNLGLFERELHHGFKKMRSEVPSEANTSVVRRGKVSWWPSGRLETTLLPVAQTFSILLPRSFDFNVSATPTWTIVLDSQPTEMSLYSEVKTSHRAIYDRARQSAALSPTSNKEVLLYNANGEVMDGSITTVYFFRDNKWVTPHSGSLKGITRRYALENELCSIASPAISKESLEDGETVWLSNAFRGFFTATFRLR